MKEEKIIKSLKITSIAFGLILGILSIFLVLNESFALFTSKTDKTIYSIKTHHEPVLAAGRNFQNILKNAGYKDKITKIIFETSKDLDTIDKSISYFDVSDKQNGVIMGYMTYDVETPNMYNLHIATEDNIVYANSNSAYLFSGGYNNPDYHLTIDGVFTNLKEINNIEKFDTSRVVAIAYMFCNCQNLTSIDLSHFDTSNVITDEQSGTTSPANMQYMFAGCSSLTSLDLTSFNTSGVTSIDSMFKDCSNLVNIDLSSFNTSKVVDMCYVFEGCSSIVNLDLSSFTTHMTGMNSMFANCTSLETLNFQNLSVGGLGYMFPGSTMTDVFENCTSLTNINLSNAALYSKNGYQGFFNDVPTTVHIDLKDSQGNRDFMDNFSSYTDITWV